MARNRHVQRAQLEMWLGFVGFFAVMGIVNLVGTFIVRGSPALPVVVAVVLLAGFIALFMAWRRDRMRDDAGRESSRR